MRTGHILGAEPTPNERAYLRRFGRTVLLRCRWDACGHLYWATPKAATVLLESGRSDWELVRHLEAIGRTDGSASGETARNTSGTGEPA